MRGIDSHQHFWQYNPQRYSWIGDEMKTIRKDFLPADLYPILQQNGIEGCVAVQADQWEQENETLLEYAAANNFIKGVVGWVDLKADSIEERLAHYSHFPAMKGFRHVLQGEADRAMMLQPSFMRGIGKLHQHSFTFDILIFEDQLQYVPRFAAAFPDQLFVLDHIAKPDIKNMRISGWKEALAPVAACDNVYCKISGMVTEADWHNWSNEDFFPYLDAVVAAFGMDRIMFGSDWPVCLVAATYGRMMGIVQDYFSRFSQYDQDRFFGGNATTFYKLK